jgi:hypothetical protein
MIFSGVAEFFYINPAGTPNSWKFLLFAPQAVLKRARCDLSCNAHHPRGERGWAPEI